MSFLSVKLTQYMRVNAAAKSADTSFRLDYKNSLKLSCPPLSNKQYSGPISLCRAEPLVIIALSTCWESGFLYKTEYECGTFAHKFRCIGEMTAAACARNRLCECAQEIRRPARVCVSGLRMNSVCLCVCAWDRVPLVFLWRSEIKLVGTGNPFTVATAERYKIRANSSSGPWVTDRMKKRESVCRLYYNFLADKESRRRALTAGWGDDCKCSKFSAREQVKGSGVRRLT